VFVMGLVTCFHKKFNMVEIKRSAGIVDKCVVKVVG